MLALLGLISTALAGPWPELEPFERGHSFDRDDYAVIVGVTDYYRLPDVPRAADTGRAWQRWFLAQGMPASHVTVLENEFATRESILRTAREAGEQTSREGQVWMVYVGHGAPHPNGRDGLLVGADALGTPDSLLARSVTRSELLDALGEDDGHEVVAVLDACFSGRTGHRGDDTLMPGLQPVIPTALAPASRATVLTAASADEFAGPLPGRDGPAFSYLMLAGFSGWADEDHDGSVSGFEATDYARGVLSLTLRGRTQTPTLDGTGVVIDSGGRPTPTTEALLDSALPPRGGPPPRDRPAQFEASHVDVAATDDLSARIAMRRCQDEADRAAEAHRDEMLSHEVAGHTRTLNAEWQSLRGVIDDCEASGDRELMLECDERLSSFVSDTSTLTAASTSASQVVETSCGPVEGLAAPTTVRYGEVVYREARSRLELLRRNKTLSTEEWARPLPGANAVGPMSPRDELTALRVRREELVQQVRVDRRQIRRKTNPKLAAGLALTGVSTAALVGGAIMSKDTNSENDTLGSYLVTGGTIGALSGGYWAWALAASSTQQTRALPSAQLLTEVEARIVALESQLGTR